MATVAAALVAALPVSAQTAAQAPAAEETADLAAVRGFGGPAYPLLSEFLRASPSRVGQTLSALGFTVDRRPEDGGGLGDAVSVAFGTRREPHRLVRVSAVLDARVLPRPGAGMAAVDGRLRVAEPVSLQATAGVVNLGDPAPGVGAGLPVHVPIGDRAYLRGLHNAVAYYFTPEGTRIAQAHAGLVWRSGDTFVLALDSGVTLPDLRAGRARVPVAVGAWAGLIEDLITLRSLKVAVGLAFDDAAEGAAGLHWSAAFLGIY